jgi:hypothetical protein
LAYRIECFFGDLKDGVAKTIQEQGRDVPYYKSMHFKAKDVVEVLNSNINSSALRSLERTKNTLILEKDFPNILIEDRFTTAIASQNTKIANRATFGFCATKAKSCGKVDVPRR